MKFCYHKMAFASVAAIILLTTTRSAHADIIYNVANNSADQNGWTLSGTITTDGTIGQISVANIKAFDITETKGGISYELKSPEYRFSTGGVGAPADLRATATTLAIAYSPETYVGGIGIEGINFQNDPYSINWINVNPNSFGNGFGQLVYNSSGGRGIGSLWFAAPPTGFGPRGESWIIATVAVSEPPQAVPEPSSFALAILGAIGLGARAYRRRLTVT